MFKHIECVLFDSFNHTIKTKLKYEGIQSSHYPLLAKAVLEVEEKEEETLSANTHSSAKT